MLSPALPKGQTQAAPCGEKSSPEIPVQALSARQGLSSPACLWLFPGSHQETPVCSCLLPKILGTNMGMSCSHTCWIGTGPSAPGIPRSRRCQGRPWVLRHPSAMSLQQVAKASRSCSRIQAGHPGPQAGPKAFRDSEAGEHRIGTVRSSRMGPGSTEGAQGQGWANTRLGIEERLGWDGIVQGGTGSHWDGAGETPA